MEFHKKAAEDNVLSQQKIYVKKVQKLEKATTLQKQNHSPSTETSKETLKSMGINLSASQKYLNIIPQSESNTALRTEVKRRCRAATSETEVTGSEGKLLLDKIKKLKW